MEKNFFKLVGENILDTLERKKMTQQSLADMLGVSKQVLSKIIKGRKATNVNEITMISKALGVSVDSLINVKMQAPDLLPQFSFMGKIENKATKEKFDMLRHVIDELLFLEDYANESQ